MANTNGRLLLSSSIFLVLIYLAPSPVYNVLAGLGVVAASIHASWLIATIYYRHFAKKIIIDSARKAVFVTGCDTGFGHMLAQKLDKRGFAVFAGCYLPSGVGARELTEKSSERLKVVQLDVTDDKSVQSAVDFVRNNLGNNKLWAIVNNAGVIEYSGVEWGPEADVSHYSKQMDVNTLGVVRSTKAFLPLLRSNRGSRVVIVASCASRVTATGMVAYSMTKFAVRAFADGLRRELKTWGVHVATMEPFVYGTNMGDKDFVLKPLQRQWAASPETLRQEYGSERFKTVFEATDGLIDLANLEVHHVVGRLIEAITVKEPEYFYRVGRPAENFVLAVLERLPEELVDIIMNDFNTNAGYKILRFLRRTLNI